MITERFHIILVVSAIVYLIVIVKMLKDRVTILKYTLLWLLTSGFLLLFAVFPSILKYLSSLLGVYSDVNFLFLTLISFLLILAFSLTHIVSRLNETNKRLIQELAIVEERLRNLEYFAKETDQ